MEVALTNLSEIATRELVKAKKPKDLEENKEIAHQGGHVAKVAREDIESNLGKSVISNENNLDYKYVDDKKLIETES